MEDNDIDIRSMDPEDFMPVLELVNEFAEESLIEYGTALDIDKLHATFRLTQPTSFVLLRGDKVIGVFAGHITTDQCSNEEVYEEVVWYVFKEYRKYGIKLFNFAQQWCIVHGIRRMTVCYMHNSKPDKLFALYERMGFKPLETRFVKILP